MFYSISVGINGFFRYNRFNQEYRLKSARYVELEKGYRKINLMINQLNEMSEWEALSRTKLKMVKQDETAFRFYKKDYNNE